MAIEWDYLREIIISNKYAYAIIVLVISLVLAKALLFIFETIVAQISKKKKKFDKRTILKIENPLAFIIILIGIQLAIKRILFSDEFYSDIITTLIIIVITYVLTKIAAILLDVWGHNMTKKKGYEFHDEVLPLSKSVTKIIFFLIALIVILQLWGVQVGAMLASLGVAGVILGFAFKDTLTNIFGGISLIVDNSFRRGDVVQLEAGEMGEVMEINLRSTKIKNFDNELVIIPNGQLANTKIVNYAQPTPTMRILIPISVAYGNDPDNVKEVLLGALQGRDDILKYPKRTIRFEKMADYSLNFSVIFYIKNYKEMFNIRNDITTQIYKDLYRHNIEIPFPARTIFKGKTKHYHPKIEKAPSSKKAK
jgi:MscS family membrane protein